MKWISLAIATVVGAFGGFAASHLMAGAQAQPASSETTPPAYMMVLGKVFDRPAFFEGYAGKLAPLYDTHGGRYVAIGRGVTVLEGEADFESYVVSRWPNREAALAFWNSAEYDVLRRARIDNEWGEFTVLLVDGLPETRPMTE